MIFDPRGHFEALGRLGRRTILGCAALAGFARQLSGQDEPTQVTPILEAAAARILPADGSPGAREANVGRFIDRQLAGSLAALRPAFEQLAKLLDLWARKSYGKRFLLLAPAEQDAVLEQLARGRIPVRSFPQEAMFRALHTLTLEGFLSDPIHGGNEGQIGWRSIGFAEPHLRRPGGHHGR
jgi:gluconate 2-dehydrogenase gamma chain